MDWPALREEMVDVQIVRRGISNAALLAALRAVPRHSFVPEPLRAHSYEDRALPIGHGQTISQPYMVAVLLNALNLRPTDKVLEVGTGSGYEAALLGRLAREVHSMEMNTALAAQAERRLARENDSTVFIHVGDGSQGWAAAAPYDAIVVAAAAPEVPPPLRVQLKAGGRLVLPIKRGKDDQLVLIEWKAGCWTEKELGPCAFVPLQGEYGMAAR